MLLPTRIAENACQKWKLDSEWSTAIMLLTGTFVVVVGQRKAFSGSKVPLQSSSETTTPEPKPVLFFVFISLLQ